MRKLLLFMVLILLPTMIFSQIQTAQITGTVLNSETLEPLEGANVVLFGTNIGSTTDERGKYS
jgi:hypothetical protein